jgi:hypothetical protein
MVLGVPVPLGGVAGAGWREKEFSLQTSLIFFCGFQEA